MYSRKRGKDIQDKNSTFKRTVIISKKRFLTGSLEKSMLHVNNHQGN